MTISGVGLLPTGFVPPTIDQIITDISNQYLTTIDPALDLSADQPMGQSVAISAEREMLLWDVIQTIYAALDPDAAEGILLDNVCGITGTRRRSATYSYLYNVQLTLASSTTVNAEAQISVSGNPSSVWVLQETVTSTTAGTYTGTFQSLNPGPQIANASTATVIGTPTVGWTAVTNPTDAAQGIVEDTDTILRQRRLVELGASSVGPIDGQQAALNNITGITSAFVFENVLNVTDGNNVPPHSTHAVLWSQSSPSPPANNSDLANTIAQTIWSKKDAGIGTYGSIYGTAIDAIGTDHTIYFDWATTVRILVNCVVTPAPNVTIGSGQAAAIKSALAAYALANFVLGQTVYYAPFLDAAIVQGISVDVTTFQIKVYGGSYVTSAIAISGLQIATLDTGDITVNGL